jgi:hypothetical protein
MLSLLRDSIRFYLAMVYGCYPFLGIVSVFTMVYGCYPFLGIVSVFTMVYGCYPFLGIVSVFTWKSKKWISSAG